MQGSAAGISSKEVCGDAAAAAAAAPDETGACMTRGRRQRPSEQQQQRQQQSKTAAAPVETIDIADSTDEDVGAGSCKRNTRSMSAAAGVKHTAAAMLHGVSGEAAASSMLPASKKRASAAAAALSPGCWVLEPKANQPRRSSRASDRTEHEIELLMQRGVVDDLGSDEECMSNNTAECCWGAKQGKGMHMALQCRIIIIMLPIKP
jgi:hypothetical protein